MQVLLCRFTNSIRVPTSLSFLSDSASFLCMAVLALALYPDLGNVFNCGCMNTCHTSAANCSTSNSLWRGMENLDSHRVCLEQHVKII